jgi:glycosyltransferase involved in cell wall biosynthesis
MTVAVSVMMPVYNTRAYVAEAVESVVAQTFEDFELLIVDDGSTDGSTEVLRRLADGDPRIRLVVRENRGVTRTAAEMVEAARGEFLARMDSDDIALPRRLERQVAFLRAHPEVVAAGSWVQWIDAEGDPLREFHAAETHEEIDRALLTERTNAICQPASMVRADAMRRVGGYRPEFVVSEDYDLWLRLAEVGRLANIPEVLLKYRYRPTSLARSRRDQCRYFDDRAIRDACERRGVPAVVPPSVAGEPPQTEADHRLTWAWWALSGGNLKSARKNALIRLRMKPLSLDSWKVLKGAFRGH